MIDIEKAEKVFLEYCNNYDKKDFMINNKIYHSQRVMANARTIATKIGLSQEGIDLATLIGLLHDIGRFEERVRKEEGKQVDHGTIGVEVLEDNNFIRDFIKEDKYDSIIKKAVLNHNKLTIEGLNEEENLYCRIVRDADKLDIMYETYSIFWENKTEDIENSEISEIVFKEFMKEILIEHSKKITLVDKLIGYISYIYDINFKESYKIISKNKYIDKICGKYKYKKEDTKNKIEQIRKYANRYVEMKK